MLICSLTFSRSPPFVFTPSKQQEFAVLRQSTLTLTEVSFFFFFANDFSNFEKDSITLFGLRDICLCQSSCKYKRGQNTTAASTYLLLHSAQFSKGRTELKINVLIFGSNDVFCSLNKLLHSKKYNIYNFI